MTATGHGREAFLLFLFFASLYSLTTSGMIRQVDAQFYYQETVSLVDRRTFALDPAYTPSLNVVRMADGTLYSPYGIGQSLVAIPFYVIGKGIRRRLPSAYRHSDVPTVSLVQALNPLVTALTCALLYLLGLQLGLCQRSSLAVGVIYGAGTIAWGMSKDFYADSLQTFLIVASLYSLRLYKTTAGDRHLLASGFSLGLAIATKIVSGALLPIVSCYLLWTQRGPRRLRAWALFLLPVFVWLALVGWYNWARFGQATEVGYGLVQEATSVAGSSVLASIYFWLFSTGKGIFVYMPILLLACWGVKPFISRHRSEGLLLLSVVFAFLVSYTTKYGGESNPWAWGPRYMLPIIPLCVLFVGAFLDDLSMEQFHRVHFVPLLLFAVSVGIQALGAILDYNAYCLLLERYHLLGPHAYIPQLSPILGQWWLLKDLWYFHLTGKHLLIPLSTVNTVQMVSLAGYDNLLDVWAVRLYGRVPTPLIAVGILTLISIAGVSGRQLWRVWRQPPAYPEEQGI